MRQGTKNQNMVSGITMKNKESNTVIRNPGAKKINLSKPCSLSEIQRQIFKGVPPYEMTIRRLLTDLSRGLPLYTQDITFNNKLNRLVIHYYQKTTHVFGKPKKCQKCRKTLLDSFLLVLHIKWTMWIWGVQRIPRYQDSPYSVLRMNAHTKSKDQSTNVLGKLQNMLPPNLWSKLLIPLTREQ